MSWFFWLCLGFSIHFGIDKLFDFYFEPIYNPRNRLDAAQLVDVIDSRLGNGWTANLAEHLKR